MNKYKYTDVPLAAGQVEHLTGDRLGEAIKLYNEKMVREAKEAENSEGSGDSHRSRASVFDRIGDKGKRAQKKTAHKAQSNLKDDEAANEKKLADLREKIRQEELENLELKIQKRMQEEEERILKMPRSRKHYREPSLELISDKDNPQEDLMDMIHELQKKVGRDSGLEIEGTLNPFSHSLESIPRQKNLKHYNFDSFDGMGDPEEHVNNFEQIAMKYYYTDLTKCRLFASTLKGGAQRWFRRIPYRSVHSWKQFRESFLRRFRANKTYENGCVAL